MSSEVCPFCGKTYKRLKSHLPHCKAAPTFQAPPTEDGVKTNQTTSSSSQLVAGESEPTAKGETSKQSIVASPKPKKSSKVSASASSAPPQSAELPPSTKKKKQKLSEQLKVAGTQSSISTPPPSPSPAVSTKPKKRSLRALIEAAKPDQVALLGSLEGTRSASEEPPSGSTPPRSKTTAPTRGSIIPDSASFAALSSNTKPKDAPKKKASKTKRAPQSPPAARDTDANDFWADITEEIEESSVNKMLSKSGGGHQSGITIRDARATLGRGKATSQSGRARILSQAETTDELSSKTSLGPGLSPATGPAKNLADVVGCSAPTEAASDRPLGTSPLRPELQSVTKKSSTSEQASSIPLQRDGSSQPKLLAAGAPLLSGNASSQVSPATPPPPCAVGVNGALKAGRHAAELLSLSPTPVHFYRPHVFPLAPQTLLPRAADGSKLEDRKQSSAHNRMEDAVTRRSLGQVRLRELPEWLACRAPRRPRDVAETVQRGWQWYYRRYIDVKKGGVGGVGMLLAGYCVLSYVWSYPHIKCDRWRKYH